MSKAAELAALIGSQSALSNKNMIINGAMQISQRATSATGLGNANGYFAVDRFDISLGATSAGRFTMSQSTVTDLEGFPNALKLDCTTADTSIAAGEALIVGQNIEGQNVQRLTATSTSTKAFTLSFYAKSNSSRAIASEILFVNGTNRQISKLHTIGTSWARYTMTVPAASSTQIDDDNSHELSVNFWVHAGSTYSSGTINDDALDSITNANRAVGIGSLFASTDNTLEITGMQLELGEQATPFEHRTFADDFIACQRYYQIGAFLAGSGNDSNFRTTVSFSTPMRAQPTLSTPSDAFKVTDGYASEYASTDANPAWVTYFEHQGGVVGTSNHGSVSGDARRGTMHANNVSGVVAVDNLEMDSEL